ncbi:iron ABC transporter permease [Microbacterium betulae]|uniref:Iron ABC transporter permease n=1 Tax=Microbacterium betulae TaxID=2981139 RepID=A0AA97I676_9MICO|nr:iron ABC transporter permease [Microbacterium sp. AB]WOF22857.1 iron ABC transporter permease [Microbacterium sp. AB]
MSSSEFVADRARSIARTVTGKTLWTVFVLALGFVFVVPVSMIVIGAFRDGLPSQGLPFTVDGLVQAFTAGATWRTLLNSLILVVVCGSISTIAGGLFAWIATSTNVPLRRWLTPLMVVNLFVPPLFYTFGWIMLGNAQNGLINQFARLLGFPGSLIDIQSWGGLFLTMSLGFVPFAYLLMRGAFLNRDQSLDEAASIGGASTLRTFFTVTVPSVAPAITGAATLIMVLVFQAFEGPQLLGRPAGIYVFSTQIYRYIRDEVPSMYSAAFALALIVIALVIVLFLVQRWLLRGRTFTTLTGKTSRREPQQFGPIRWVFTAVIVLFIVLNLVLPLSAMVLGSLQSIFGVWGSLSLDNYAHVLSDPMLSSSLALTAYVSIGGGFIATAVALLTAYVVLRRRGFLKSYTSFAMWVPWALPGIVLALAYLFTVLTIPGLSGLYGTSILMTAVLVIGTIPLCSRIVEGALAQLSPELEEAGKISGAGPLRVLGTIVLRLVIPSFAAGWFLAALFISGNLAIPTLLAPPGVQPVAQTAFQLFLLGDLASGAALFMIILVGAVVVLALAGTAMALARLRRRRKDAIATQVVPSTEITREPV